MSGRTAHQRLGAQRQPCSSHPRTTPAANGIVQQGEVKVTAGFQEMGEIAFTCHGQQIHLYIYNIQIYIYIYTHIYIIIIVVILITSGSAQGGGGSFKNRKPIGEVGCCESGMAERTH